MPDEVIVADAFLDLLAYFSPLAFRLGPVHRNPLMVAVIRRIIGVYNADSGVGGHLRYVSDKIGRGEGCALCDITNGTIRKKGEFIECKKELGLALDLVYRDQLTTGLAALVEDRTPAVVAELEDGSYRVLLRREDLDAARGDVRAFRVSLEAAMEALSARE